MIKSGEIPMQVSRYLQSLKFKPLLAGAALLIATGVSSNAATIDLSGLVNSDLTTYSGGSDYPQNGGSLTVNGIGFQLATLPANNHTAVIQGSTNFEDTQTYVIPVNQLGVTTVYTLINSAFGSLNTDIGSLTFVGLLGETYTYTLTEGVNVRDHFNDGFVNSASNLSGTANFGPLDRLDMQSIVLPIAFATDTLTEIDFFPLGRAAMARLLLRRLRPRPLKLPFRLHSHSSPPASARWVCLAGAGSGKPPRLQPNQFI
jgi:hypothetical protein